MSQEFPEIDARNAAFIASQKLFFVSTAPLSGEGRVNLSPKGLTSFAVLGPTTVAYLDLVGSGAETIAHVRENGRITFMFCAFEGPPRILRLYGRGEIVEPGDPQWAELYARFPDYDAPRSIVKAELLRIADSCGYGVPEYRFEKQRSQLVQWAEKRGQDGIAAYKREHNRESLDGLPALRRT